MLIPPVWPALAVLPSIASAISHAHAGPSAGAARAPVLRRALLTEGDRLIRNIPGTNLVADLTVHDVFFTIEDVHAMSQAMIRDAQAKPPGWRVPSYDMWPQKAFHFKFELRSAPGDCDEPAINSALIHGLGAMLSEVFPGTLETPDAAFTGTVAAAGDSPAVFAFRCFAASSRIGASERKDGVEFDENDLKTVREVKRQILEITTETDLILFIGNTGR